MTHPSARGRSGWRVGPRRARYRPDRADDRSHAADGLLTAPAHRAAPPRSPPAEHEGLLAAFVTAASTGDVAALVGLLAPDATLVTDGGPTGAAIAGFRSLPGPLTGAELVARFVCAVTVQAAPALEVEARVLNGRRALVRASTPKATSGSASCSGLS